MCSFHQIFRMFNSCSMYGDILLVGKAERNRQRGNLRHSYVHNINLYFGEIGWNFIELDWSGSV